VNERDYLGLALALHARAVVAHSRGQLATGDDLVRTVGVEHQGVHCQAPWVQLDTPSSTGMS
jgi:hypothetical protein